MATRFQAAVMGFDVDSLLPELSVPTLVLAAARSRFQPLATQVSLYEAIPDARIAVVDGPSQQVCFDRPQECTGILRRFIRAVERHEGPS